LELLQGEVLAREAARYRRRRIRASETADPGSRNFGFAVRCPCLVKGVFYLLLPFASCVSVPAARLCMLGK
jgi:hypothetical protein